MPKRKFNDDPPGEKIFMLHDMANGNPGSNNYCWWFETRAQAMRHKRWQKRQKFNAPLSGPFEYRKVKKKKK